MSQGVLRQHIFYDRACPVMVLDQNCPSVVYPLACHDAAEVHLVKRGHGAYLIAATQYPCGPGTLIVIRPREIHRFLPVQNERTERLSLFVSLPWLEPDRSRRRRFTRVPNRLAPTASDFAALELTLRRLQVETGGCEPNWEEMTRLLLREFLVLLDRAARAHAPSPPERAPLLQPVVAFIDTHFAEDLRVGDVARCAGFSPRHLSRLFRGYTGLGVKQYLLHRRILEAKRLLEKEPALTVATVSERIGFGEPALFIAVFKRIVTITPGKYRTLAQEKRGMER